MLRRLKSHPHLTYYLSYLASELCFGTNGTAYGPLIPYLSEQTGIPETGYSFLFSCRSFGMLLGAFLLKLLQKRAQCTLHQYITIASVAILFFNILFSLTLDPFFQGLWLFLGAIFYSFRAIAVGISVILINPHQDMEFFLLLCHGSYGVGGLLGPLFVYLFEINTVVVSGLLVTLVSIKIMRLESPETFESKKEEEDGGRKSAPWQAEYLLVFILFLYIGMEYDYQGWISSYATISHVSSKEHATVFPMIFWVVMTLSRFGYSMLPGSSSQKMSQALIATVVCGVISLLFINMDWVLFTCYLSAVMFGLSMANMYPLTFSIPSEFGWRLNEHQANNIISGGVIGEGVLTMITGKLMDWLFIDMLFVFIIGVAVVMWLCRGLCLTYLAQ